MEDKLHPRINEPVTNSRTNNSELEIQSDNQI